MSKSMLERLAFVVSVAVLVGAVLFWCGQVGDVVETLRLAAE
jgi:hypothetical protein